MKRLLFLEDLVKSGKADSFARYGLAMEYRKLGRLKEAATVFDDLLQSSPDYLPQYLMAGQLLVELEQVGAARQRLEAGIALARKLGNHHALSELEAFRLTLVS
jgi:predicted Zn-dependent protease